MSNFREVIAKTSILLLDAKFVHYSYRTNVDPDFACRTDKVHCIRQSNYLTVFTLRDYESGKDFG